jgi:phospholipase/carboxylesterase
VPWDPGGEPAFERGVAEAAARLARLLEKLPAERPTVGRPVLTGFSQGGILTFAVATSRPELVSSALPLAGMLPRRLWPRAPLAGVEALPLRALHGGRDELLPPGPTEALVAHLRELGFDAALRVYPDAGHFVTDAMLREYHALLREAVERAAANGATSATRDSFRSPYAPEPTSRGPAGFAGGFRG